MTIDSWFEDNHDALCCAEDWIYSGCSSVSTLEHLRKRHQYPFKSSSSLAKWARNLGMPFNRKHEIKCLV